MRRNIDFKSDLFEAKTHILKNGLKIYLSSNKEIPRIYTSIAVKAGSKNDPQHASGIAHYLEHMMFKGTQLIGTLDFDKEKKLIKKLSDLCEEYKYNTDDNCKKNIWQEIDKLSVKAAKYAIPNEYDKLISLIGSKGTNAYTSFEKTVYLNDIPSNQLENWLRIESDRFRNPVFRLFHTELETVFEEKIRSLDNDESKLFEKLFSLIFCDHPYGKESILGSVQHLQSPSIKEMQNFYNKYYIPNNMAICLSGDLDIQNTISLIEKYWGNFKRKDILAKNPFKESGYLKQKKDYVYGPASEKIYIGYRFKGANSTDSLIICLVDMILSNSLAGLIDINLNQSQKLLSGGSFTYILKDHSIHVLTARPKFGQTIEEIEELLILQINEIKAGNFDEKLLDSIMLDLYINQIKKYETNSGRVNDFVESFVLDINWHDYCNELKFMSKISKKDIVRFVCSNYNENNIVVFKKNSRVVSDKKIVRPYVSKIKINRKNKSNYLVDFLKKPNSEIAPDFINFNEKIKKSKIKDNTFLYLQNTENSLFKLSFIFDFGTDYDKKIPYALDYFNIIGTDSISSKKKSELLYKLGCELNLVSTSNKTEIQLSGIKNNFTEALQLLNDLFQNAIGNDISCNNLKSNKIKERLDAKLDKNTILMKAMLNFAKYGPASSFTNVLSDNEINSITSEELINKIRNLFTFKHKILYYGPEGIQDVKKNLSYIVRKDKKNHINYLKKNNLNQSTSNKIYLVDYESNLVEFLIISKGLRFEKGNLTKLKLYNEYFGTNMSSIVFQDLRESQGLAYSVYSSYSMPKKNNDIHFSVSYMSTQVQKLSIAIEEFMKLIDNMPISEDTFNNTKNLFNKKFAQIELLRKQF